MQIGKLQTRGQVTLPRVIRQAAGLQPGDVVAFEVTAPGRVRAQLKPIICTNCPMPSRTT